jgi:hypothetical protein
MMPKGSARGRALFVVLGLVLGACGPGTRAPSLVTAQREAPDGGAPQETEAEEDADGADPDGEPEASSDVAAPVEPTSPCPAAMVLVGSGEMRFCIDKYEASLVEVDSAGNETRFPHWLPVDGRTVRAVSEPDVFPQGFISEVQAEDACAASGKRLCSYSEWKTACMGPSKTTFPYGNARKAGTCHDTGRSAVAAVFGLRAMTDPVAVAPSSKPSSVSGNSKANSKGSTKGSAAASSRGGGTANRGGASKAGSPSAGSASKASKPGRQAHVTTKGKAAETTRPRATRPGAVTAKAEKPSKRKGDKSEKNAARATKRIPAKTSTRPASVEPSVWTQLNDPRLGQVDGALSKTGSHDACVNGYGVVDMVGNLHEWVKTDPSAAHGTFAGGYYLDTTLNGDGCHYRTTAHAHDYHDYSTGFRCCAEPTAAEPAAREQD